MLTPYRIGQGYDLHRIKTGRPLWLGGVQLESTWGLDGHSDADVLLHAITDAFLGALALEDIGHWFPDTDPQFLNADSKVLLQKTLALPPFQDWELGNLDCTIFAEQPKIGPWRQKIRESLSALLIAPIDQISLKAKTNEKLDSVGRGEAIAASATVLLVRKTSTVVP